MLCTFHQVVIHTVCSSLGCAVCFFVFFFFSYFVKDFLRFYKSDEDKVLEVKKRFCHAVICVPACVRPSLSFPDQFPNSCIWRSCIEM